MNSASKEMDTVTVPLVELNKLFQRIGFLEGFLETVQYTDCTSSLIEDIKTRYEEIRDWEQS